MIVLPKSFVQVDLHTPTKPRGLQQQNTRTIAVKRTGRIALKLIEVGYMLNLKVFLLLLFVL